MSRTLWPPAAAISRARFTFSWPMTSAKSGPPTCPALSGFQTGAGARDDSSPQMGHQLLHIFHAVYRHALGQGGLRCVFRRHIELSDSGPRPPPGPWAAHRLRGAARPVRLSSPTKAASAGSGGISSDAARMPSRIGRSYTVPSLRRPAGARFTVMRLTGILGPAVFHRRTDPFPGLLHCRIRQAYDIKGRQAAGEKTLHTDLVTSECRPSPESAPSQPYSPLLL